LAGRADWTTAESPTTPVNSSAVVISRSRKGLAELATRRV
jgi:hypothetical protein